jgi:short-subunit dehydrogenase
MSFREKYGPWALISGASEGVGRALARRIAAEGIHCILIARRQGPLDELALEIGREFGVECVAASIDLAAPDACAQITAMAGDREIGLYVSNAGSDPEGARFLDRELEDWLGQVQRGVVTIMGCCHHFGRAMRARGRGGLLLIGSGSCYGGSAFMAAYSGIKAFGLNFAESLWAELQPCGVDMLYMALGTTDTPELRRLLEAKGLPLIPGLADPSDVADVSLARLPHGPLHNWGLDEGEAGNLPMSAAARRARALAIGEATKRIFGA